MTKTTRKELLSAIKQRYLKGTREEKTEILNEFCKSTGYNRLYAIRILQADHQYRSWTRERPSTYGSELMLLIIKLWELLDYPCGTRLKPQLLPLMESLVRSEELFEVPEAWQRQLRKISAKTLDRRLKRERIIRRLKKNRGTTRHGSLLKSSIPIRITNWDTRRIGFMEMDTVAHCGDQLAGEFIYSLDMVEIATGWSEQIAVMGKGEEGIVTAIKAIKQSLPFDLKGLDSDTGSEFVNWHMVRWCKENNLSFTRSRPYYKNDNAYVEQKNYTHIRRWLGYRRYDTQNQLQIINNLYRNELRQFNNFFRPVMKIASKEKVNNSVCKKKYGQALTPYQRLMQSNQIPPKTKSALQKFYESLNPVKLKSTIEAKLKRILGS
jgi:hypothetical protein